VADELYDELTLRRIDRAAPRQAVRRTVTGPRRTLGGGALLTAVALGLQEALQPEEAQAVIEEIRPADDDTLPAVTLLLVPDAPWQSRALVRPWLL
jgi:hypothetical protein